MNFFLFKSSFGGFGKNIKSSLSVSSGLTSNGLNCSCSFFFLIVYKNTALSDVSRHSNFSPVSVKSFLRKCLRTTIFGS